MRGLCIATGQYSSSRVSAVVLILGGSDDMEVDDQDREQVESERESRGARGTVNETNCNTIKKIYELTSSSIQTCPTTMCLVMNAIVFVGLDGDALQFVLLIRGENDFSSRQRL